VRHAKFGSCPSTRVLAPELPEKYTALIFPDKNRISGEQMNKKKKKKKDAKFPCGYDGCTDTTIWKFAHTLNNHVRRVHAADMMAAGKNWRSLCYPDTRSPTKRKELHTPKKKKTKSDTQSEKKKQTSEAKQTKAQPKKSTTKKTKSNTQSEKKKSTTSQAKTGANPTENAKTKKKRQHHNQRI
jgi:hypothetical protein